ncbi:L-rhamnose mutarotase [Methylobacterium sp. J-026]|uniref:L-rhamnose mutarotase n=1 Tax=Methylobacterium sp. J-026 TaxID=2836624 RepID=UPI001FB9A889|nr:L-rhamnose mutarotase [Methylobacterium sp. J-026]MCJ2134190.1 L-rhamnose mutarotase [Methylobacterium sp. J-026]
MTPALATPALEKIAFRMTLKPGAEAAYRARHDAIWPDLVALLRQAGVRDYSIHLDAETNHLFAVLWRPVDHGMDALPTAAIMRRWWDAMADLMAVGPGNAPVAVPLETLFHLA